MAIFILFFHFVERTKNNKKKKLYPSELHNRQFHGPNWTENLLCLWCFIFFCSFHRILFYFCFSCLFLFMCYISFEFHTYNSKTSWSTPYKISQPSTSQRIISLKFKNTHTYYHRHCSEQRKKKTSIKKNSGGGRS